MGIGGVETSLNNFIQALKTREEVSLYLINDDACKIENKLVSKKLKEISIKLDQRYNSKFRIINKLKRIFNKVFFLDRIFLNKLDKCLSEINHIKEYQIGVCFAPWDISLDTFNRLVDCKFRICFVHGDVSKCDICNDAEKKLAHFDKILCVSKSCCEMFKRRYPMLSPKVDYCYNLQDVNGIIKKSNEYIEPFIGGKINILSVSRLSEEKGLLRSLKVLKKLHNNGLDFIWHIVGDGPLMMKISIFIKKNNMSNYVFLYGNKENPYPYFKQANLFYIGSYHEAAPMVYAEAMILGCPVLTTKTCSAEELVGENGFVCENSEAGIEDMFVKVLSNPNLIEEKKEILKQYNYDNDVIMKKFKEWG